jgi:hypothetical protein
MKTTKRLIAVSALHGPVYKKILADKQALRDRCAPMAKAATQVTDDKKGGSPLSFS